MQLIHDFGISPTEYEKRGMDNEFPEVESCPKCSYPGPFPKHGFYWRNAVFSKRSLRIPICRYKCPSCQKTISILPDFLLPHYQHALVLILWVLEEYLKSSCKKTYRQLLQFYLKRYYKNLNRIKAFLRELGFYEKIPKKEKAIKLLEMIHSAFPKAKTFAKRFQEHFHRNFMAN